MAQNIFVLLYTYIRQSKNILQLIICQYPVAVNWDLAKLWNPLYKVPSMKSIVLSFLSHKHTRNMSKLILGLHVFVLHAVFLGHHSQGYRFQPTDQLVIYQYAWLSFDKETFFYVQRCGHRKDILRPPIVYTVQFVHDLCLLVLGGREADPYAIW